MEATTQRYASTIVRQRVSAPGYRPRASRFVGRVRLEGVCRSQIRSDIGKGAHARGASGLVYGTFNETVEVTVKNRIIILAASVVAVVLTVAACGSKSTAATVPSPTTASSSASTTVAVKQISGLGSVLVTSAGLPLYANEQDTSGSTCNGSCTAIWKPLTVTGTPTESGVSGKLGVISRTDGSKQVTVNGKPVYTFVEDQPGQVTGNGAHDQFGNQKFTWHVVLSSGQMASSSGSSSGAPSSGTSGY